MSEQVVVVEIEKIVPGAFGLARVDGRVLLVRGAIPGERVRVAVERAGKGGVQFGRVVEVVDASPDRIEPAHDPRCGGLALSHVRYERQLRLKADMLADALRRTGRLHDVPQVEVMPSPETGWRMRVRLHLVDGQLGFYREGTHTLCTPAPSQCPESLMDAARATLEWLPDIVRQDVTELSVSEDLAGERRAVLVTTRRASGGRTWTLAPPAGVAGVSVVSEGRVPRDVAGDPSLRTSLEALSVKSGPAGRRLQWHPGAFFQANRAIVPALVARVLASLDDRPVVDLFAGVGLFGVSAAAAGATDVACVEGEPTAAAWLERNARELPQPEGARLVAHHASVEHALAHGLVETDGRVIIVDPPRTGLPAKVTERLAQARQSRLVYVSCDPPTLARDLRRFVEAGWSLTALHAYDMFPQTAHLESVAELSADR